MESSFGCMSVYLSGLFCETKLTIHNRAYLCENSATLHLSGEKNFYQSKPASNIYLDSPQKQGGAEITAEFLFFLKMTFNPLHNSLAAKIFASVKPLSIHNFADGAFCYIGRYFGSFLISCSKLFSGSALLRQAGVRNWPVWS